MNNKVNYRNSILIIIILASMLLGFIEYGVPKIKESLATKSREMETTQCDLTLSACSASQDDKSLQLKIASDTIHSLTPLVFKLKIENIEAESVVLSLEGKEMFMGINQKQMTKIDPTSWEVTTEMAACTTGSMIWRVRVDLYEKQNPTPISASFEFTSQ